MLLRGKRYALFSAAFSGDCPLVFQSSILLSFFLGGFTGTNFEQSFGVWGSEFFCHEMPLLFGPETDKNSLCTKALCLFACPLLLRTRDGSGFSVQTVFNLKEKTT